MAKTTRPVHMNLEASLVEELDQHVRKGVSRTSLVEEAIRTFLRGRDTPQEVRPRGWSIFPNKR